MATHEVEVVKQTQSGETGTWTFRLRIVETDDAGNVVHGPFADYGIDPVALDNAFGGDYSLFIASKVDEMMKRYVAHVSDAPQLQGQRFAVSALTAANAAVAAASPLIVPAEVSAVVTGK